MPPCDANRMRLNSPAQTIGIMATINAATPPIRFLLHCSPPQPVLRFTVGLPPRRRHCCIPIPTPPTCLAGITLRAQPKPPTDQAAAVSCAASPKNAAVNAASRFITQPSKTSRNGRMLARQLFASRRPANPANPTNYRPRDAPAMSDKPAARQSPCSGPQIPINLTCTQNKEQGSALTPLEPTPIVAPSRLRDRHVARDGGDRSAAESTGATA